MTYPNWTPAYKVLRTSGSKRFSSTSLPEIITYYPPHTIITPRTWLHGPLTAFSSLYSATQFAIALDPEISPAIVVPCAVIQSKHQYIWFPSKSAKGTIRPWHTSIIALPTDTITADAIYCFE